MSKATILFVTLILTLGCADERVPTRFISTEDTELYALCEEASDRWYEATGIAVECLYGRGDSYLPMSWGEPGFECATGSTTQARIRIRREAPPCQPDLVMTRGLYLAVVTHEMGHAIAGLGAGHAPSGVMGRYVGDTIDQASIDWLCAHAECAWTDPE